MEEAFAWFFLMSYGMAIAVSFAIWPEIKNRPRRPGTPGACLLGTIDLGRDAITLAACFWVLLR